MAGNPENVTDQKLLNWLRALRLQFYPMTWLAYTLGALGAAAIQGRLDPGAYWLGYAVAFLVEAATVFTNDLFDYESDRHNRHASQFNGGARTLVDGRLGKTDLSWGAAACVLLAVLLTAALLLRYDLGVAVALLFAAMLVLGPGYTTPPLKLAWRGLGELDVALTHSTAAILCGFIVQGASWTHPFPWLVSAPLFLAILPSILLAGLPDLEADKAAGKRTLVVRLGRRPTALLALLVTLAVPLSVVLIGYAASTRGVLADLLPWSALHSLLLAALIFRYWKTPVTGRIDGLLIVALTYTIWYSAVPIMNLL